MLEAPSWMRWTTYLFGVATVAFLVQAANRAYVATQLLNTDASTWQVNQTMQSLTLALI